MLIFMFIEYALIIGVLFYVFRNYVLPAFQNRKGDSTRESEIENIILEQNQKKYEDNLLDKTKK